MTQTSAPIPSKPHFLLLDALRGVAALVVVCFHIFEAFATSHLDQRINHGYLAVDFFFILSGFVIGYAYDDRWSRGLSLKDFALRRLIRLQPMVVMGTLIGALTFYAQGCAVWDVTSVSLAALLLATVMGACMVPAPVGVEVRGLGEMYPLNGPSWSLFFEYVGNVLYALLLRRLSTLWLAVWVVVCAAVLAIYAIAGPGDLCVGFALTSVDFAGGMLRLLFAFASGLLLSRLWRQPRWRVKGIFWWCSLVLVLVAAVPRIGGSEHLWANGIYDALCVVLVFPLVVMLGASGHATDRITKHVCKLLGDISYPLYMVHYPFIYMYYAWVKNEQLTFAASLPGAVAVVVGSVLLAYLCLRLYDQPLRWRLLLNVKKEGAGTNS